MTKLTEQKMWDYVDGSLPAGEHERIKVLIDTDPACQALYHTCVSIHVSLGETGIDEPSMRFTRDVMERLQQEPVPGTLKSVVDRRVIYVIAGFFMISIASLLMYMLLGIDAVPESGPSFLEMPSIKLSVFSPDSYLVKGFLFADIVIGLYLLDSRFRKRLYTHSK